MNKFAKFAAVVAPSVLAAGASHAAIDVTAATAGISDAQTALVTVLGAFLAMGIAVYGLKRVIRIFGK